MYQYQITYLLDNCTKKCLDDYKFYFIISLHFSRLEIQFPQKIINPIEASHNKTEIKVKIENTTSQPVKITTGLRQGNALSLVLFNLEKVVLEMNVSEGIPLGQLTLGRLE